MTPPPFADAFYEVMAEYTRLEAAGPVVDVFEPDMHHRIQHAGRLEGMRRVIGLLNGMPVADALDDAGPVAQYIARWQQSHAEFLGTAGKPPEERILRSRVGNSSTNHGRHVES